MKLRTALIFLIIVICGSALFSLTAKAHEAYVLPHDFFWQGIAAPINFEAINALKNPANLYLTLEIITAFFIVLILNFAFRKTALGKKVNELLEKISFLGPIFVRVAIAASFFYSAQSMSFLGPELGINNFPFPHIARIVLYAASFMIAAGFLTEIAALAALVMFTAGFFIFGTYLLTYLNYLGEIIVLALFGMRKWSLDGIIFGKLKHFLKWEKYGTSIVRIFYGLALIYAGVTVKFLHPQLTLKVINDWNLTQFHWLFPSDPLLVVLGAGLAEFAIGFFIVIGFEMRLTVIISLFYITLSLLYFRELVWPHFMLYGISLNLIIQPETFTLDQIFFRNKTTYNN